MVERQGHPGGVGDYDALLCNYTIEDYLRDADGQNLVKSVHLDVGWDPADPVRETRSLQGVADEHGFPHGIVGYADLASPDVADVLDGHLEYPNFRGIRQSMNFHHDPAKTYLDRPEVSRTPEWRRGFAQLATRPQLRPAALLSADERVLRARRPGLSRHSDHRQPRWHAGGRG